MNAEKEIRNINLTDIIPNRFQPRLTFEQDGINELAESIKQHGLIQPLVLRRVGNKFEIIAGERRYKASTMAGLESVPALIVDLNDGESAEVALIENIQRRELSSIEEARSYKNIIDLGGLKQDELAKRMGKTQSTVSNKLRLLNLSQEVQDALLKGQISERHARALLVLKSAEKEKRMLARIINERLNVRRTDEEVEKMKTEKEEEIFDIIEEIEEVVEVNESINATLNPIPSFEQQINKEEVLQNPFFNFTPDNNMNTNKAQEETSAVAAINPFASSISAVSTKEEEDTVQMSEDITMSNNKYFNFFGQEDNSNTLVEDDKEVSIENIEPVEQMPVIEPIQHSKKVNIYDVDNLPLEQFNPINSMNTTPIVAEEKISPISNYTMEQSVISDINPVINEESKTEVKKEDNNKVVDLLNQFPIYENAGNDLKNIVEFAPSIEQEFNVTQKSKIDPENFITVIKAVRDLVNEIEDFDYYVEGEESDFEDYYQFVIKIDKERL